MWGRLSRNAAAAATSAAELVTSAAETAHIVAKKSANEFTLARLKTTLEGSREQVWAAPDVWVTISEVDLTEGLEAQDINIFSLKGLLVKAKVEIVGSKSQLAAMLMANSIESVMGKLGAGEQRERLAKRIAATKTSLAARAAGGSATRSAGFDLRVDLVKTVGVAEVVATVQILDSSSSAIKKYLSNARIQRYAEDVLGRQMTRALTQLHQENLTLARARDVIHAKAVEVGAVATEYTNSDVLKNKAKEVGTAKSNELKARATEFGAMATEYAYINSNVIKAKAIEVGTIKSNEIRSKTAELGAMATEYATEYANARLVRAGIR